MLKKGFTILIANTETHFFEAKSLIREYSNSIGVDLCFQNFDKEMDDFPGEYVPPAGALLLADVGNEYVGCIALRPLEPGICELKRLYVRPGYRGMSIGKHLILQIISEARSIGYRSMRLDTLPQMNAAMSLYEHIGFKYIEPYRNNPVKGSKFMEMIL